MMRIVIIGGNAVGVAVATHLRRADEKHEIIILEESDEIAVSVHGLPYLLADKIKTPETLVGARPEQLLQLFNIITYFNVSIKKIKIKDKTIVLQDGRKFNYDKLIIAERLFCPTLNKQPHLLNASLLKNICFVKDNLPQTALIVGNGAFELRLAEALIKKNVKVILLSKQQSLLEEFDDDFADLAWHKIKPKNLEIICWMNVN